MFHYEEVKAALKEHFGEKRNFLAARLDFFRTVQQEGQSITDVLAELRNKAKECDFEEQCCVKCQDALRDRLVMGCRHTFIQQAILKEGDASLTNVLQCAKMAELLTWWKNEQRISQLKCSLLLHMSINRRFYYKSRPSL